MSTIAHISDLHLSADPARLARLQRVLNLLQHELRPDALLVTGDIADGGLPDEYEAFTAALPPGIPVVCCPGNHDHVPTYRRVVLGEHTVAPAVSTLDLPDLRIVTLDSSTPDRDEGLLSQGVLVAAAEALHDARRAILALHHPPAPIGHPVVDTMLLRNPQALADLLDEHPQVIACCTGHIHRPMVTAFAGRPVLSAPGVASALRPDPAARPITDPTAAPGLALHTVGPGTTLQTEFHFAW